jgi:N-acyl-D-aspartate/D-glutamate deacylase
MIETWDQDYLAIARRGREAGTPMFAATGVVALSTLATFQIQNVFGTIPGWEFLFDLDEGERLKALSDPDVRARLRKAAGDGDHFVGYPLATVDEAGQPVPGPAIPFLWRNLYRIGVAPDPFDIDGPSLAEEARRAGRHPVDILLDGVVASRLRDFVILFSYGQVPEQTLRTMQDPAAVLSRNDTGAHLAMLCNAESTQLLAQWVRKREALSLERAIHLLTGRQAQIFQLHDRGVLAPGCAADVVLLDPERVAPMAPELASDIPGGGRRIAQRAVGIERVIVSGRTLLREGRPTGELPGRFLRPADMAQRV